VRSGTESFFRTGVSGNMALLGAIILTCALQFLIVYVPIMQPVFKTQQLSGSELGITILLSFVPLLIIEAVKITKRLAGRQPQ
jgi:Ca2+-transporting ATPase